MCSFPPSVITYTATADVQKVETIEQKIGRRAEELGYDSRKAQAIAWAESRFDPNAESVSSTASGVYQFLDGTFSYYCIKQYKLTDSLVHKNDPDIQIECALKMLTELKGGENHWSPSRASWPKYKPTDQQLSLR